MANFVDAAGKRHDNVDLGDMKFHTLAKKMGITFRQCINAHFPTAAGSDDAFTQMCMNAGLRFKHDNITGIPATNLASIWQPGMVDPALALDAAVTNQTGGTFTSQPSTADSRILFLPALIETVENALQTDYDSATAAFESLVADGNRKTIASRKYEQAVVDFQGKGGPHDSQWTRTAQNAPPPLMLSITASDIARTIPSYAIGMEISAEALQSNSLDVIALPMQRFFRVANYNEWVLQLGYILSGDADAINSSMATCKSALSSITAQSLDSAVTVQGTISHKAWMKFLYQNSMTMTKTNIVTDFDTMWAIENRTGRPTNVQNNSMDRLDVPFKISYPAFESTIDIVVMPAGTWSANTIMALDKKDALMKVISSVADYSAAENIIMKKSTQVRVDRGHVIHRMYDAAFDVMTLTVT